MNTPFNELQHDALVEAFNIAISSAAVSLSRLTKEEVRLDVPMLEWMSTAELKKFLSGLSDARVSTVMQHCAGDFSSRALLLFPQSRALEVVRLMVGDLVSHENLSELEQEAVCEVGNILLNACMSTLAQVLGVSLHTSLPHYLSGAADRLFGDTIPISSDGVMMIHITLTIERREIQAYLAFVLDAAANQTLLDSLDRMLGLCGGGVGC